MEGRFGNGFRTVGGCTKIVPADPRARRLTAARGRRFPHHVGGKRPANLGAVLARSCFTAMLGPIKKESEPGPGEGDSAGPRLALMAALPSAPPDLDVKERYIPGQAAMQDARLSPRRSIRQFIRQPRSRKRRLQIVGRAVKRPYDAALVIGAEI